MKNHFVNKVVIISGASSGIGRETARLLAEKKARVVLAARSTTALEQLAHEITEKGGQALAVPTDITQKEQVDRLIKTTLDHWGQIDILIANAGQYIRCPINELTPEVMEQSMAVNFYGGLYQVLAVLPHMRSRRSGHIVLMLTMDAKTPLPFDAPYVAAKSAMSGFADVLRQELRGSGVHLSAIYPGRIDTPMIANLKFLPISAKIPPITVAQAVLKCIERRRVRVLLPAQVHLLNILNFFSPLLADFAIRTFRLEGWEEN